MSVLNELLVFLSKHKNGEKTTHTGMYAPFKGSWCLIEPTDRDKFWEIYEKAYHESKGKRFGVGITEVQDGVCPVLVDIDMKFSTQDLSKGRQYTLSDIQYVLDVYVDAIKKHVKEPNMDCYVFEKPSPRIKDDHVKDGFHIMFMNVCVNKQIHKSIHQHVNQKVKTDKHLNHLLGIQTYDSLFDSAIVSNNWLMYGSHKQEEKQGYVVTHVYQGGKLHPHEFTGSPREFSIQGRSESECYEVIEEEPESECVSQEEHPDLYDKRFKVKSLLNMLNAQRCDEEPSWIRVGWVLRNIDPSFVDLWDAWSQQSEKYKPGECEKRWKRFKPKGYKINSLCYWAKEDNPEAYHEWMQKEMHSVIEYSIYCGAHYDIAMILFCKYEDRFKSTNPKRDEWYYFDNHRWHEMPAAYVLMNMMSTELTKDFARMHSHYKRRMIHTNPQVVKEFKEKADKCKKLMHQVKDNHFKSNVLKECARLFYDPEFEANLDDNANLIGFNNGVYDIENMVFRDGHPDDYLSKTTGIDYIEFKESDQVISDILSFFDKVFPQKDIREYVLTMFATFLGGSTEEQTFQIWTGGGSNGKSTVVDLFERCFGPEYTGKFSTTLLTRDRASSNACTPELQDVMRKRFASMQEPNDNDVIYTGAMKEYTGGDKIYSRGLYSKPTPFKPQFKLVMLCNKMPMIKGWDYGTWRRIRVVNFTSSFVDNPNPNNTNEFAKDRKLPLMFDEWKEAFMWLLIQYLKRYTEKGLKEPDAVIKASREYKKKSDAYFTFLEEHYLETSDDSDKVTSQEMYEIFKNWWRTTMTSQPPSKSDLMDYIQSNTKIKKSGKQYLTRLKYIHVVPM